MHLSETNYIKNKMYIGLPVLSLHHWFISQEGSIALFFKHDSMLINHIFSLSKHFEFLDLLDMAQIQKVEAEKSQSNYCQTWDSQTNFQHY